MKNPNIPFSLPCIDEDVQKEIHSCLTETGWLTTGPKTKEFEEEISKISETNHTLCVNSWTSAALLLIRWLDLSEDDEIIIPAYTYAATALSVLNSRVKCVMVDIDDDFLIDINKIEKAITSKTKAIMPVDLGGMPVDYPKLKEMLESKAVKSLYSPNTAFQARLGRPVIISDAAHSIGSQIKNRATSIYPDFTIYSFHSVKNITTGEGGAITFKIFSEKEDLQIIQELRLLSLNGQNKSAFEKNNIGGWRYDILTNGLKVNMPDLNASIGLAQIRKYKSELLPERESIFRRYNKNLSKQNWAILPKSQIEERSTSYHLYQLRIKGLSENQRNMVISKLAEKGINANVHYIPLPLLSYFKNIGYNMEDYPNSLNNYVNEISLPLYNKLKLNDVDYICSNLIHIVNELFSRKDQ